MERGPPAALPSLPTAPVPEGRWLTSHRGKRPGADDYILVSPPHNQRTPLPRSPLLSIARARLAGNVADDFERGWLMLADIYIGGGKYDLAEELCRRCLAGLPFGVGGEPFS